MTALTLLVIASCGVDDNSQPTEPASSTTAGSMPPMTSTPTTSPLPDAPWSAAVMAAEDVPLVLVEQWAAAGNRLWCSALAPGDLEALAGTDAVPRAARFDGGWAVAWDKASGPGSTAAGDHCTDCGRSAFGIAGAGILIAPDTALRMPTVLEWNDGSRAGYTGEGFDPSNPKLAGEIVVAGQGCVYQVWSHLGALHLEQLIQSLRLVSGMQAEPVTLLDPGSPQRVIDGGPAPWFDAPLALEDVPALLVAEWERAGLPSGVPLVAFGDLGEGSSEAVIRTANVGTWGVAWDNPAGPGHDSSNRPCQDCGRGVIGLGAAPSSEEGLGYPNRVEWDDGSYAEFGPRLGDPRLPPDRVIFNDPETGASVRTALQARLVIAGIDADFIIWSHLGEVHLLGLLQGLRLVETSPG